MEKKYELIKNYNDWFRVKALKDFTLITGEKVKKGDIGGYVLSSKICSKCGNIKEDLTLKDRIFVCPHCGSVIDRDLNASINLKNYGKMQLVTG